MKKINHDRFDQYINAELSGFEYKTEQPDWNNFEKAFGNRLPSKPFFLKSFFSFLKVNLVPVLLIFCLVSNLILMYYIFTKKENSNTSSTPVITNTPVEQKQTNDSRIDSIVDKMDYLDNKLSQLIFHFTNNKSDTPKNTIAFYNPFPVQVNNNQNTNEVVENKLITKSDSISNKSIKNNIIENKNTEPVYIAEDLQIAPQFCNTRKQFFELENLPDFVREQFRAEIITDKKFKKTTIVVQFVVSKDGNIADVDVITKMYPEIANEVVHALNTIPEWKPGQKNNKDVNSMIRLSVIIAVNNKTPFPNF